MFKNAGGKEIDSGLCASFSSALMTSQRLGTSINPIDYAFQNIVARKAETKVPGFCRQSSVDTRLGKEPNDLIQVFSDVVRGKVGPTEFYEMKESDKQKTDRWLNDICGERIPRPAIEFALIDLKPKDWSGVNYGNTKLMSASEMGDEIDSWLDKGH